MQVEEHIIEDNTFEYKLTYLMDKAAFDKAYNAYHEHALRGSVFHQKVDENTVRIKFAIPNKKQAEKMLNHWRTELKTEITKEENG